MPSTLETLKIKRIKLSNRLVVDSQRIQTKWEWNSNTKQLRHRAGLLVWKLTPSGQHQTKGLAPMYVYFDPMLDRK